MICREIKNDFERFAPAIWRKEQSAPSFFRASVNTWQNTYKSFLDFAALQCAEIHGLFTGKELVFCVYFEKPKPDTLNVHLSVLGDFEKTRAVKEIQDLRDVQFIKGIKTVNAWVLEKNLGLKKVVRQIGFAPTELSMMHGTSHGRSLRWRLHRMVRI